MTRITRRGFIKGAAALGPLTQVRAVAHARHGAAPTERFDVVVAGAGHNSLIAAAYLAKAGYRCVVLEEQPMIGGGARTAEITLPGYRQDIAASVHSGLQRNPLWVKDELHLKEYGLEYITPDPIIHISFPDGAYITQWRDLDRTCAEFARLSRKDGDAYRRLVTSWEFGQTVGGSNESRPDDPSVRVWRRRLAMSAWEIVRDTFEDDHCRAFILAAGHLGGVPPGDPMTARSAYTLAAQQTAGRPILKGGSGMLTEALGRFIGAHNGVVLRNKAARRLIIENGRCVGVECADGSTYRGGKAVLSTIHVKHLVDMVPRELWPQDFVEGVATFQPEHAMFVTHYATTEPPKYPVAGGTLSPCESVALVRPERLLRLPYENAAGEVTVDDPSLQIVCATVVDPTRAPAGRHTLKISGFQPYGLKEGPRHWDVIKNRVSDGNLAVLRRLAPNLTEDKILGRHVVSPLDLERLNAHFWRGSAHAGASSPSQSGAMRPMPGWAQYRMPIPGLYQTGATTAPGGSVNGNAGRNAVAAMLEDFGTSIEEVVSRKT